MRGLLSRKWKRRCSLLGSKHGGVSLKKLGKEKEMGGGLQKKVKVGLQWYIKGRNQIKR